MPKIQIDTDILQQSSSQISSKASELEGLNSNLNSLIETIKEGWEGAAADAYYNRLKSYQTKATNMVNVFNELKKYSDTTVSTFSDLDTQSATKIRNSF